MRLAVLTIASLLFLGAVCEVPRDAIVFINETDQTVEVVNIVGDHQGSLTEVRPGATHPWGEDCIEGVLEARTEDGDVVDRYEGPLCQGDPPWRIGRDD